MLDKRTAKLLDVLLRICGEDGAYKIIEIADLQREVTRKFKLDHENIIHIIKFLSATEMIDIKYTDDKVVCVAILPKGRIYEEEQLSRRDNRAISKGLAFMIVMGSFFAAIVGAVVASVIMNFLG